MKQINKFVMVPVEKYERWQQQHNGLQDEIKDEMQKDKQTEKENDLNVEDVISTLPTRYKSKGLNLLSHLMKHGVGWNSRGEMMYQDETFPQTSMADLVRDALLGYKQFIPLGIEKFYQILSENNVPLSFISNPRRRAQMIDMMARQCPGTCSDISVTKEIKKKVTKRKWSILQ